MALLMKPTQTLLGLCFLAVCSATTVDAAETPGAAPLLTYEHDIRPILKSNCFDCHGEQEKLSGGLDLRLRGLILKGGDSGPSISPGHPEKSLLVEYVSSGEMPPGEELRLSAEEVALISRWIAQGAQIQTAEPASTPKPGEFFITEQERQHWSYRPIRKPPIPASPAALSGGNPIDAFIAARQAEKGLSFSPEAERIQLVRRASFDLLGLPPSQEEVATFLADNSPNAYERLIDRLLDSPQYGEHWGRHWLDIAGYADSEGYTDADEIRPDAWRYRDYVVNAFNADKPWNEFIIEQLAGDELAKATTASATTLANRDDRLCELLTATGFLRMAPDGTGSKPMDPVLAQNQVITETIKILSSALLGQTVGCAECHDHRFDPIPQEDFYRLRAIIAPVFDHENWRVPGARRVGLLSAEDQAKSAALEAEAKKVEAQYLEKLDGTIKVIFDRVLATIPEEKRDFARKAHETDPKQRTPEQKTLIEEQYPMLNISRGSLYLYLDRYPDGKELKAGYEKLSKQVLEIRERKPKPEYIRIASEDVKHVPITHLFFRGDVTSPEKAAISPAGLTVLSHLWTTSIAEDDPALPSSGRRLAYARRLTDGTHPLTARVLINRFWMHHFGQAFVASTGDFGVRASPPTHPDLMDWLASDFMEHGWRLKRLHRLIMTSRTYRQSSLRQAKQEAIDSDNELLWRMPVRRLEAEAVRDAILLISGSLDARPGGAPMPVVVTEGGIIDVESTPAANRRSLYIQARRSQPVDMLEAFDAPSMEPNCERRTVSTVPTQSLALLNDQFVLRQAEAFADRILGATPDRVSPQEQLRKAWMLAYQREPRAEELKVLLPYLEQQQKDFTAARVRQPQRAALASLCQVIFGSNEFLYVD
jgi:hypothetical protein